VDKIATMNAAARPAGVDTASGVEQSPGVKDCVRLRQFIAAARSG
jgi:phosphoribosylanthranilate isomerase